MSQVFVLFRALPEDCNATFSKMVPEEEAEKERKVRCRECERAHLFIPTNDA